MLTIPFLPWIPCLLSLISSPIVFHQVQITPRWVIKKETTTYFKHQLPHNKCSISLFTEAKLLLLFFFFLRWNSPSTKLTILMWIIWWLCTLTKLSNHTSTNSQIFSSYEKKTMYPITPYFPLSPSLWQQWSIFYLYQILPVLDISGKFTHFTRYVTFGILFILLCTMFFF